MQVGDCLEVGGPPDRPETPKVQCGSPESNFKVVGTVESTDQCPTDVDSYYSLHSSFSGSGSTVCMDIDWVVGGCMSIDPENDRDPVRVDCDDVVPNRQRATQIIATSPTRPVHYRHRVRLRRAPVHGVRRGRVVTVPSTGGFLDCRGVT